MVAVSLKKKAKADNNLIGRDYEDVRELWRRGFPVPAFDDASRPLLPESEARLTVNQLRAALRTQWDNPDREAAHVERLMRLLGYEDRAAPHTDSGGIS